MTTIAPHQMMILSAARTLTSDVPDRYPNMVNQTNRQRQTNPQHSPCLKSEYHGDRYNENTDGSSVSEENRTTPSKTHTMNLSTHNL
jgi:hypothetical protein